MGGSEQSLVTLWMSLSGGKSFPQLQHVMSLLWLLRRWLEVSCWEGVQQRAAAHKHTYTCTQSSATPNTHPNNTSSHQTRTGKFWISAGKRITFSLNLWAHKNMFLILGGGSGLFAVFCFCDVTCIRRCAQEFCAGFRAIKDTLLQKKQG